MHNKEKGRRKRPCATERRKEQVKGHAPIAAPSSVASCACGRKHFRSIMLTRPKRYSKGAWPRRGDARPWQTKQAGPASACLAMLLLAMGCPAAGNCVGGSNAKCMQQSWSATSTRRQKARAIAAVCAGGGAATAAAAVAAVAAGVRALGGSVEEGAARTFRGGVMPSTSTPPSRGADAGGQGKPRSASPRLHVRRKLTMCSNVRASTRTPPRRCAARARFSLCAPGGVRQREAPCLVLETRLGSPGARRKGAPCRDVK
eukprot:362938-Chlamydomonas_euryale.AAC.1